MQEKVQQVEQSISMPKRSKKERRQQVLEVILNLLNSEEGMQRITTEKLAKAVGVSEGALYRYFTSKTEMFGALLDHIEAALFNYIDVAARKEQQTANKVRAMLYAILEFASKNPGVARILAGHVLMYENAELKARVGTFIDRIELKLVNVLQLRKRLEQRAFEYDERILAGYLVNFCEGQFARLVRSNFRYNQHQHFEKQWALIKPLFD